MEEIYANVELAKCCRREPSANESSPRNPSRRFLDHGCVLLVPLSVFLLVGLVVLAVAYDNSLRHSWDLRVNLTEGLQNSRDELSSLKANLSRQSRELERLRAASRRRRCCPDGWNRLNWSCYLFSDQSLSWEKAREFCVNAGADLVTIDNAEEQNFVSKRNSGDAWIGLTDREKEGRWKWAVDDSPLNQGFWSDNQPDNGGKTLLWGKENCVHIEMNTKRWNDLNCDKSKNFICEKMAE